MKEKIAIFPKWSSVQDYLVVLQEILTNMWIFPKPFPQRFLEFVNNLKESKGAPRGSKKQTKISQSNESWESLES